MSQTVPAGVDYPGKSLGIVGLVSSFSFTVVGSVVSLIAWRQSRAAGYRNTPALAGIAVGVVALSCWIVLIAVFSPIIAATTV